MTRRLLQLPRRDLRFCNAESGQSFRFRPLEGLTVALQFKRKKTPPFEANPKCFRPEFLRKCLVFSNFSPIAASEGVNGGDVPLPVVMATPAGGNQTKIDQ